MLLPPPQVWRLTPCALLCLALRSVVLAWLVMQFRTHAYFSLDAAPFTAVYLRFAAYPPCFEIFTFHSVKHTGIGAHFRVKLLEIWARIRHINETYLGAFQSKLWPVPTQQPLPKPRTDHSTQTRSLRSRSRIDWAVEAARRVRGELVVAGLQVDGLRGGAGAPTDAGGERPTC